MLISVNSDTSARVLLPATVAASISVPNNMTVATSALHAKQNLSVLPGNSKSSATHPHTLQWPTKSCSVVSIWNAASFLEAPCSNLVPTLCRAAFAVTVNGKKWHVRKS